MSLYESVRPSDFNEVIGQEEVITSLQRLLVQENPPRAFLLHGPSGCGKTTIARIIKKKLNCDNSEYNEMNVANTRGIETMREVISKARFSPFFGKVRIFVFDEAHKITTDAQNSLLKIVEEPPPGNYFIFCTTEPDKVIPTLRNRCTQFNLSSLDMPDMVKLLEIVRVKSNAPAVTDIAIRLIARAANGSARGAIVMFESIIADPEHAEQIIEAYKTSEAKALELCRMLLKGDPNWRDTRFHLKTLLKGDEDLETLRLAIINYMGAVLLSETNQNSYNRASSIISMFSITFQQREKGLFIHRCYEALMMKDN